MAEPALGPGSALASESEMVSDSAWVSRVESGGASELDRPETWRKAESRIADGPGTGNEKADDQHSAKNSFSI